MGRAPSQLTRKDRRREIEKQNPQAEIYWWLGGNNLFDIRLGSDYRRRHFLILVIPDDMESVEVVF